MDPGTHFLPSMSFQTSNVGSFAGYGSEITIRPSKPAPIEKPDPWIDENLKNSDTLDKTLEVVSQIESSEVDGAEESPDISLASQADSSIESHSCNPVSQLADSQEADSDINMDEAPERDSTTLNRLNSGNIPFQEARPVFQISRNPGKGRNSEDESLSRHSRIFKIQKMPGRR